MIDLKMFLPFDYERTDGRTLVVVKLLPRLKMTHDTQGGQLGIYEMCYHPKPLPKCEIDLND